MSKLEAGNPLCEGGPLGIHGTSCKFTYIKTIKNQPNKCIGKYILATGFHDSTHLQNITQFGSFLRIGLKIKHIWNHHPLVYTIHGWNGYFWRAWSKVHDFPFSAASYTTERRRAAAFLACGMLLEDNRVERKRVSYSNKWLLLQ